MLVETMTPKEMMAELLKDRDGLNYAIDKFVDNNLRYLRRPNAKFPAEITKEKKTARGNLYFFRIYFQKRRDVFKNNFTRQKYAIMQTKEGLSTLSIVHSTKADKEVLFIYRPHVFKRYKERMGIDIDGLELIKYFYQRNSDAILHGRYRHKEGDEDNDFMMTIVDGALFGTKHVDNSFTCYIINTFIANDTMQDGYKSKFNNRHNEAVERFEEYKKLLLLESNSNYVSVDDKFKRK